MEYPVALATDDHANDGLVETPVALFVGAFSVIPLLAGGVT
ncbi:MAG TPA: hypothetical protein PKN64_15855 [Casimicrobium sp.]|jgi:hypothetical protein|nr:hypothetical protein [Casimicrobium sp.]